MRTLLFIILTFVIRHSCLAGALTFSLDTNAIHLRKDAPVTFDANLIWAGPGLLEGRLEFSMQRGAHPAGMVRTAEIVMQPGKRAVPVLLPPPPATENGDGLAVRVRFVGKSGTWDFGDQKLGIYGFASNELVFCVPRTDRRITELDTARERSLHLDTLRPKLDAKSYLSFTILTSGVRVENLPAHPTGWCAYDAVYLDGPAFAALGEKQLTGLRRWIEGGGSAWVCADVPAQERHTDFLNALCDSHGTKKRYTPGDGGRITAPGREPLVLSPGLGVAVIVTHTAVEKEFSEKPWRTAVAALWKLPPEQVREVAAEGVWSDNWAQQQIQRRYFNNELALHSLWTTTAGMDSLRPDAPKTVPLAIVGTALVVLLLGVGPGDFFLLGWLRRRRWTWLLFPACCALCAWWIGRAAERSIGSDDRRGTLRFVDVSRDGRVLRELRYEFLLPARDRQWEVRVEDGLAVSVPRTNIEDYIQPQRGFVQYPAGRISSSKDSGDAVFEWESASRGRIQRSLRQWTPALMRVTTFPVGAKDDSGAQWDSLEASNLKVRLGENKGVFVNDEPVASQGGLQYWFSAKGGSVLPQALRVMDFDDAEDTDEMNAHVQLKARLGRAPGATGDLQRSIVNDNTRNEPFSLAWRKEGNVTTIYRRFAAPPEP